MSEDTLYYQAVKAQMSLGKQALLMAISVDKDERLKGQTVPIEFNGHKYKMTIEKDNGDE